MFVAFWHGVQVLGWSVSPLDLSYALRMVSDCLCRLILYTSYFSIMFTKFLANL